MKLDHLYSLRREFTIIGLTGRTGSGCTTISGLLAGSYNNLKKKGLRDFNEEERETTFYRKYTIINNYISTKKNWIPFDVISYKNVLILYILNKYGNDNPMFFKRLLLSNFKEDKNDSNYKKAALSVNLKIQKLLGNHDALITKIQVFSDLGKVKIESDLLLLNDIFFGKEFKLLCKDLLEILQSEGYYRRTVFLHHLSCNIRKTGDPLKDENDGIKNIYSISTVINRIIKARKFVQGKKGKPTKIVIDSLRNSLEVMFFKERYSAFYMLATKDVLDNSKSRIVERLQYSKLSGENKEKVADKLLELDETEYKTNDFSKGNFSSPDVENCIQKSDFHILNLKKVQITDFIKRYEPPFGKMNFVTREEQLLKLIALINQPGIITPSALERSMQIANTAKLNSGCISRNVGAAITDTEFHIKSIGWNDVAKGHTSCNLRNIEDLIGDDIKNESHYSDFEKGLNDKKSIYKYKNKEPSNFKGALKDYFSESYKKNKIDLNGKNCSFCFKTIHNHYEGEANQVHTRSLHAEENAMLQITKLGGVGVQGGILFTTASPCELCSKKAFQLGIKTIYFIDPYPGISNDQILKGGDKKSRPIMIPFSGAIGSVYQKLYDNFLSYKDEVSMTLELKSKNKIGIQFVGILESLKGQNKEIRELLELKNKFSDQDVIDMIIKNINSD